MEKFAYRSTGTGYLRYAPCPPCGIEREKIDAEYDELIEKIKYFAEILASEEMVLKSFAMSLRQSRKFGDERRTEITANYDDIDIEDLIEEEQNVITMTHYGYIKRLPCDTYAAAARAKANGLKPVKGLCRNDCYLFYPCILLSSPTGQDV